jgi:cytochrome P450
MLKILSGGDTTAATMRVAVYYLAKNPAANKKLTSELDAADLAIPPQWKDIHSLPYLDAVSREAIRISPAISMTFEHEVPQGGFTLPDGRFLPAGTKAGVNPAVTSRDYDVFGQDADDFNPDRGLQKPGEEQSEYETRVRCMREITGFAFGAGIRICMGRNLAQVEMYKFFATLYSLFDVSISLIVLNAKPAWNLAVLVFLHVDYVDCLSYRLKWWIQITHGSTGMLGSPFNGIFP